MLTPHEWSVLADAIRRMDCDVCGHRLEADRTYTYECFDFEETLCELCAESHETSCEECADS